MTMNLCVETKSLAWGLASRALLCLLLAVAVGGAQAQSKNAKFRGEPVTLNFVNADIEGVTRAVGAIVKQQFIVDPRVKGNITLYSEEPLSPREVYLNYLAALRGLGFTVVMGNAMGSGLGRMDDDLLLFVANWPAPRRGPWRTLLRARAIENLCYSVGVNRVGSDGNGLAYAGDSAAIDFLGEALVDLDAQSQVVTTSLSATALNAHRERFPAWRDADAFNLLD